MKKESPISTEAELDKIMEYQQPLYDSLSELHKREAETLAETILDLSGEKNILFSSDYTVQILGIDKDITEEEAPYIKTAITLACADIIAAQGFVLIEQRFSRHSEYSGAEAMWNGVWRCLADDEVEDIAKTEVVQYRKSFFKTLERERF